MPWQDELIPTLRVMVNDLSETAPSFSDDILEQVLLVAAKQVASEGMTFTQTFVVSVANGTLSPDPTIKITKDDSYVNLVTIKAACIIDRGEARTLVKQGLFVKDGNSAVDLRSIPSAKLRLLEKGWCAVYDSEKFDYVSMQLSDSAGALVVTPFRMYANSRSFGQTISYDPARANEVY